MEWMRIRRLGHPIMPETLVDRSAREEGCPMPAVMHAADSALRATAQPKDATSPYIATTLYDVIAALQDAASQDDVDQMFNSKK